MAREETLAELTAGRMPQRYLRNAGTIGVAGQLRLLRAKVAVIGAGGLGGHVVELLARQGVGCLLVMDGDCFTRHNLNRQILATEENLGQNKAVAAAARVAAINSDVEVIAVPELLTSTNGSRWLAGSDVIVDALDSLNSRRILFQAAQTLAIPVVHGAIAGFTGQVATVFPGDAETSDLLFRQTGSDAGIETRLGNPAATPALAAALQAQETVKLITGIGQTLSGRLLYFDLEYNLFEIIDMTGRGGTHA